MGGLVGGLVGSRLAQGDPLRFDRRLPIPPLIDAAKQGNAVKLKVSSGRHAFIKARPTPAYGYSGPVLGPAIRMRRGDEVQMTVENALGFDTTVHWHGLLVPGDVDGGRIKSSSPADRGVRDSRSISRPRPRGFILICTMTRPGRFTWASPD
jgi:FtsP/CotA-like multicopper oxidase with cupredoxin domain